MDEKIENERGYAFVAFSRSYEQMLSFGWAAAMKKWESFPSKYAWIGQCLDLYDRMIVSDSDTRKVTNDIIRYQRQGLNSIFAGRFTKAHIMNPGTLHPKYISTDDVDKNEDDRPFEIPYTEKGFSDIEDADIMRVRLLQVRERLNDEDYEALTLYIAGRAETLSEVVQGVMGLDKVAYNRIRRSIPRNCKGLVLA